MKQFIFIFQLFFILISTPLTGQEDLKFKKLTSLEGLSHNTVYAISQDREGFMWFGTREGLNRFDGQKIETYYSGEDSLSGLVSNRVNYIEPAFGNGIYIGTPGGLSYYDSEKQTFREELMDGRSLGYIHKIIKSSDTSLYICSAKGLFVKYANKSIYQRLGRGRNVKDLIEYKKDVFWELSTEKIFLINSVGETIKQYNTITGIDGREINLRMNTSCLFKSTDGNIWLGTNKDGLFRYNPESDSFESILTQQGYNPLEVNIVRVLEEDHRGNIWIGTESGLFIYNSGTKQLKRYDQSFNKIFGLNDKAIYSIYKSSEDIMWVGTYFGGVNMVRPVHTGFRSILADGGKNALSGKAISKIIQDQEGKYWIATEDGGINVWDRSENTFSYLKHETGNSNSLNVNNVHSLYEGQAGDLWIGTFLGGLNRYDPETGNFRRYKNHIASKPYQSDMVYAIQGIAGDLWVGTQTGLNFYDRSSDQLLSFMPEIFANKFVYDILKDRNGDLWFCMNNTDSLFHLDRNTGIVNKYSYATQKKENQIGYGIISSFEDSTGRLWFGTIGQGLLLFDPERKTFSGFSMKDGLPNNYIYGILEDGQGHLWLSTNKGLSEFDPAEKTFRNFDISHGLPQNQFNFKSYYKDKDGWMYFGTINGLCYFHPDSIHVNHRAPKVYLTDFKLFNKPIGIGEKSSLHRSVHYQDKIELEASENMITIGFASIDYFSDTENSYAYYLEGFEDDWNQPVKRNTATYTNLSPGTYTFKVKSSNNDGVWSENTKELQMIIKPPFWLTYWAFFFYLLIVIALIVLIRIGLRKRHEEKMVVQLERLEKDKLEELNEHKLNFFTYISHEFKTPLTLIIASIDKLMSQIANQKTQYNDDFLLIRKNAKRLLFLIDQLMEFRKIEMDHSKFNYSQGDLILFLEDTFNAFSPLFSTKNINHQFSSSCESHMTYFDSDKIEKILTNLISNAVKHTSEGDKIDLDVDVLKTGRDGRVQIILSDTGSGIDPDDLSKVFAPFYQSKDDKKNKAGTGLGLALVRSLVDLMDGTINVKSNLQRGTFITIELPINDELNLKGAPEVLGNKTIDIEHEITYDSKIRSSLVPEESESQFELLIVEDNIEILDLLIGHFNTFYKVHFAEDGKKALEKIEKIVPDAIISDVMMPEVDGLTLCRKIKSNIKTSHIPVILLTAKTTNDNRMEGLDAGADMYVTKPFNLGEIDLRIRNILTSREQLRNHFQNFASVIEIDIPINNKDQDFLKQLTDIVEKNIENSDFNITMFCQEAGISRSLLHMKLKKLADLSASEFVKTIRLKKAVYMIENTDLTISEVAYKVGYSDPNYFTRTFREKYGSSPTEFRNNHLKKADEDAV